MALICEFRCKQGKSTVKWKVKDNEYHILEFETLNLLPRLTWKKKTKRLKAAQQH